MIDQLISKVELIQERQFQALEAQDIALLEELEREKTALFQQLAEITSVTNAQRVQLENISNHQKVLEKICVEVRDELAAKIKQVMDRHKAVSAYKDLS